jgi:hypothetical protein
MKRNVIAALTIGAFVLQLGDPVAAAAGPGIARAKPLPPGPNCIDSTVRRITTRLTSGDAAKGTETQVPGSGYQIFIRGRLPDKFGGTLEPTIVFYQEAPQNALIARERAGDRVQVCVTGFPEIDPDAGCNPVTDRRGRLLRVYDYARHFAYAGANSEHGCGGA